MDKLGLTLRQALLLPYILITLVLAGAIGWLSYAAGLKSVDQIATHLSTDMVARIEQGVANHLAGSRVVLDAVAPEDVRTNGGQHIVRLPFPQDFKVLETRLWAATGLWTDPNNYVYYAPSDGRFLGVLRHPDQTVEVREKKTPTAQRDAWLAGDVGARDALLRSDAVYDPAGRDWYKRALAAKQTVWTAPYTSFTSRQLIVTKARPIKDAKGDIQGVLAADVPLNSLSDFLQKLSVSANGVAYIVERSGGMIASSSKGFPTMTADDKQLMQVNLNQLPSEQAGLVSDSFARLTALKSEQAVALTQISAQIDSPLFGHTYVAGRSFKDQNGLDWLIVVALPRMDLMGDVQSNVSKNLALVILAALIVLVFGVYVLNWVTNDIRRINNAALSLSRWEKATPIKVDRRDEIGDLARSFYLMEQGLMHDALSGLLNREAFRARVAQRLLAKQAFSVLFLDLNLFKKVNDTHGHDVGDAVLRVTAKRMLDALAGRGDVGRLGGDEFVIVFSHDSPSVIAQAADRTTMMHEVDALIRQPIVINENLTVGVGTSIGCATYPEDGLDAQTLLKTADERMYAQKNLRSQDALGALR